MPKPTTKPFRINGEDYAEIVHLGIVSGPQAIDINMDTFKPQDARRLAAWLLKAADEVEAYNRKRKRTGEATQDDT